MAMMRVKKWFEKYSKRRAVRHGLPFILFCVSASWGLREITEIRYLYRNTESFRAKVSPEGFKLTDLKELTLESQYEKLKETDIDNWENIRIERPYEE